MASAARLPIDYPGFDGRLALRPAGFWTAAAIICDGAVAPRKGRTFTVKDSAGQPVLVQLKGFFFDPIPQVLIGGQTIVLARPFAWYEYLLMVLPLVLIPLGGALGGLCGAIAVYVNAQVLRMQQPAAVRLGLAFLVIVGAAAVWFVLALMLSMALHSG